MGPLPRSIHRMNCQGIEVGSIVPNRDVHGWCGHPSHGKGFDVRDDKVLAPALGSTGGLNLSNCQNVVFRDCLFPCSDDNIAIKELGNGGTHSSRTHNPADYAPNRSIGISECIFWTDNNNAVVLGQ